MAAADPVIEPSTDTVPGSSRSNVQTEPYTRFNSAHRKYMSSIFSKPKIYTKTQVEDLIHKVPHKQYGQSPKDPPPPDQYESVVPDGAPAGPRDWKKMNTNARILVLKDSSKADRIVKVLDKEYGRKLVESESNANNCMLQAVLDQVVNTDHFPVHEDGSMYNASDLRKQAVAYMAMNYEKEFTDCEVPLKLDEDCSFKKWMLDMLEDQTEADLLLCMAVTKMMEVSLPCLILVRCIPMYGLLLWTLSETQSVVGYKCKLR